MILLISYWKVVESMSDILKVKIIDKFDQKISKFEMYIRRKLRN